MKQKISSLEKVNQKLYEFATKSDYGELRPGFGEKLRINSDFK